MRKITNEDILTAIDATAQSLVVAMKTCEHDWDNNAKYKRIISIFDRINEHYLTKLGLDSIEQGESESHDNETSLIYYLAMRLRHYRAKIEKRLQWNANKIAKDFVKEYLRVVGKLRDDVVEMIEEREIEYARNS
jgi:flagellar motor component MotA